MLLKGSQTAWKALSRVIFAESVWLAPLGCQAKIVLHVAAVLVEEAECCCQIQVRLDLSHQSLP